MLLEQKSSCDVMIDEKNKLINDFQQVNCVVLGCVALCDVVLCCIRLCSVAFIFSSVAVNENVPE